MALPMTYTPQEVGKILKIHPKTVLNLMKKGKLPSIEVGEPRRMTEEQLREIMKAKEKS